MASAFSREVQLTRDEFLRQLPDAVGELAYRVDGEDIVIGASVLHLTNDSDFRHGREGGHPSKFQNDVDLYCSKRPVQNRLPLDN